MWFVGANKTNPLSGQAGVGENDGAECELVS